MHVLDTETVWIRKKKPLRVQSWDELLAIREPFPAPGETDQAALYTWDHPLPQPVNGAYTEPTVAPILEDLYVDHLQKNALAKAIENDHPKGTVMVMAAAAISVLLAAVLGVGALSRFV